MLVNGRSRFSSYCVGIVTRLEIVLGPEVAKIRRLIMVSKRRNPGVAIHTIFPFGFARLRKLCCNEFVLAYNSLRFLQMSC